MSFSIDDRTSAFSDSPGPAGCPAREIAAYIDGELSPAEELNLELHVAECSSCRDDLNAQKQFFHALDLSLGDRQTIELPENFTRNIVTTAESAVGGLRQRNEARNALFICSFLVLIAILSVGSDLPSVLSVLRIAGEKVVDAVVFFGHCIFNASRGVSIVFGSIASQFVFGTSSGAAALSVIFGFTFVLFSRLLKRGSRA